MMRRARPSLGTLVVVSIADTLPEATLRRAFDDAFAALGGVQRRMSFHDPASDVSRLNRADAGQVLSVDPHTWQVLQLAQAVADASGGMFNIACAPRLVEWACLPAPAPAPPRYLPDRAVLRCEGGPAGTLVRKLAPGWVDLGGIAKGYAVDLALAALAAAGVDSACVNAGGDLRVLGPADWPVAIRDPRAPSRAKVTLTLRAEALATSATYFSARRHAGQAVSALVDGRSGAPLTHGASVSVRAATCAVADALTKVVAASGDPGHASLQSFGATALII
ncbi:MAG: FAD:protein FMN transferase [Pseudomonadota bacterium]